MIEKDKGKVIHMIEDVAKENEGEHVNEEI